MPHRSGASACLQAPYVTLLGIVAEDMGGKHVRLRLPYRDDNTNRNGSLHGGAIASLVDAAGAAAAAQHANRLVSASSIDLAIHYLAPARREALVATARVLRHGRETAFIDVEVTTASGAVIARALVARRRRERSATPPVTAAAPDPLAAVSPERLARSHRSRSPFTARLGVTITVPARGQVIGLLPWREALAAHDGAVHEGALAALADSAGGVSAWMAGGGFDPHGRAATVALHLALDATVCGEDVLALATTPWSTGPILVNAVTLRGRTSGRALGRGSVTYRLVRPPSS